MHLSCPQNLISGIQNFVHQISAPPGTCCRSPILPPPKTVSQLRRFLGMLNFHRCFLPHVASFQTPLHDVLSGPKVKGSHPITWTDALHNAFNECKASLSKLLSWLIQIHPLHSPRSRTLQPPPWVLSSNSGYKTSGSPLPSSPGSRVWRSKNTVLTIGSSWRFMRP